MNDLISIKSTKYLGRVFSFIFLVFTSAALSSAVFSLFMKLLYADVRRVIFLLNYELFFVNLNSI